MSKLFQQNGDIKHSKKELTIPVNLAATCTDKLTSKPVMYVRTCEIHFPASAIKQFLIYLV